MAKPVPPIVNATKTAAAAANKTAAKAAAKVAAKGAAKAAPTLISGPTALIAVLGIVAGFVVLIVVAKMLQAHRGAKIKLPRSLAQRLSTAFDPDQADAVGIVHFLDTNKVEILPLKKLRATYISADPSRPLVVVPTSSTEVYSMHGRPVIDVVAVGNIGSGVSMKDLAVLGLASLAIEDPRWHGATSSPLKTVEDVVRELIAREGERLRGRIPLSGNVALGFEVSMAPLIAAVFRTVLPTSSLVLDATHDYLQHSEQLAKLIEKARARLIEAKSAFWFKILVGIGIASVLAGFGIYFAKMAGVEVPVP